MRLSELMNIDPNVGVPEPAETVAGGDAAGGGDAGIPGVGGGGGDEGGGGGLYNKIKNGKLSLADIKRFAEDSGLEVLRSLQMQKVSHLHLHLQSRKKQI